MSNPKAWLFIGEDRVKIGLESIEVPFAKGDPQARREALLKAVGWANEALSDLDRVWKSAGLAARKG